MSGEIRHKQEFQEIDLKDFTWVKFDLEKY